MAAELERSVDGIYKRAHALGLADYRTGDATANRAYDQRRYRETRQTAHNHGTRWTERDDTALIGAYGAMPEHEIARHLGRTLWAIRTRVVALREQGAIP